MTDYEKYVKAINSIYAILEKTKSSWNDDNSYELLKQIDMYKNDVLSCASFLEKNSSKGEINGG